MEEFDNGGLITLKGQRSYLLPVKEGLNTIWIKVLSGILRINHCSYTPDGGTWLLPPDGGRQAHYNLKQKDDLEIIIDVQRSYNKPDRIEIVNQAFFQRATFIVHIKDG